MSAMIVAHPAPDVTAAVGRSSGGRRLLSTDRVEMLFHALFEHSRHVDGALELHEERIESLGGDRMLSRKLAEAPDHKVD